MLHDTAMPAAIPNPAPRVFEIDGLTYCGASWTPAHLEQVIRSLSRAGGELAAAKTETVLETWNTTVECFLDPSSTERRALRAPLRASTGLSSAGVDAAIGTMLEGVGPPWSDRLFTARGEPFCSDPLVVVLASNIPGLAVQPLLPALANRRPTLLKSSRREPFFAAAFIRALAERLPMIGRSVAATTWDGGDEALERPVMESATTVVAYGGAATLEDLRRRVGDRLLEFGPKLSIALIGSEVEPESIADELARDIALFDQRGCLSLQAVFTAGPARPLAEALSDALRRLARDLPQGRIDPVSAARVHQLRREASMRGLFVGDSTLDVGTVVVDPLPDLRPSPGLRTVRVHPVTPLARAIEAAEPHHGRLQGAVIAGRSAEDLRPAFAEVGVTRFAPPGRLQNTDTRWVNGGIDLATALGVSSRR